MRRKLLFGDLKLNHMPRNHNTGGISLTDEVKLNLRQFGKYLLVLCAMIVALHANELKATHIVGGSMSYQYLGKAQNNFQRYKIILTLRRDCSSTVPFDARANFGIFRGNGDVASGVGPNGNGFFTIELDAKNIVKQISSDCRIKQSLSENEKCIFEQATYTIDILLPYGPTEIDRGGYIVSYQRCCRNGNLANVTNPLETGTTYFVHITDAALKEGAKDTGNGNSSPLFDTWPDAFVCSNFDWSFNHSATDLDGDSLAYSFCTPFAGFTIGSPGPRPPDAPPYKKIQWRAPFTESNMFPSDPPVAINPRSGLITGFPASINLQNYYLLSVCVKEYRKINGQVVLLSETIRDCELIFKECEDPPTANFTTEPEGRCNGLTYNFTNQGTNYELTKWKVNEKEFVSKNLTYTFPKEGIYEVKMIVSRESSSCKDSFITKIYAFNNTIQPDIDYTLPKCDLNSGIQLKIKDVSRFDSLLTSNRWRIVQDNDTLTYSNLSDIAWNTLSLSPVYIFLEVESASTTCKASTRDTIFPVRIIPQADFAVTSEICSGFTVDFKNLSLYSPVADWILAGDTIRTTASDFSYTFPYAGDFEVELIAYGEDEGCFARKQTRVKVYGNNIIPDFTVRLDKCDPDGGDLEIFLQDKTSFEFPVSDWNWSILQGGQQTNLTGSQVTYKFAGVDSFFVKLVVLSDSTGCKAEVSKGFERDVFVPQADFDYKVAGCAENGEVILRINDKTFGLNPNGQIDSVVWIFGNKVLVFTPYNSEFEVNVPNVDNIQVTLQVYFESACNITIAKNIPLGQLTPKGQYELVADGCDDDDTVNLTLSYSDSESLGLQTQQISWNVAYQSAVLTGTGAVYSFTVPKNIPITVTLITLFENGCADTLVREENPGPFATIEFVSEPIILCLGQSVIIAKNLNPDWIYTWSPLTGLDFTDPLNPIVLTDESATYTVTVTDGLCTVMDKVDVVVLQDVDIIITGDSTTCYGNVDLTASSNYDSLQLQYQWSLFQDFSTILATGSQLSTFMTNDVQTFWVRILGTDCASKPFGFTVTRRLPEYDFVDTYTICPGDMIQNIGVYGTGANQQIRVTWDPDPHIAGDLNSNVIKLNTTSDETGDIYLTFTVTNQYGCVASDSILIRLNENPTNDFSFDLVECGKFEVKFNITNPYIGLVSWDTGNPGGPVLAPIGSTMYNYTFTGPGTYTVTLTNRIGLCPFKPVTKTIELYPPVDVVANEDKLLCGPESVTLNASSNISATTYVWSNLAGATMGTGNSLTFNYTGDTVVVVTVTDPYGCTSTDSVNIKTFRFEYTIVKPAISCDQDEALVSVILDNPANFNLEWLPTGSVVTATGSSATIIAERGKEYVLKLTSIDPSCMKLDTFTLDIPPAIQASLMATPQCEGKEGQVMIVVDQPQNYMISWLPAAGNKDKANFVYSDGMKIKVYLKDNATGCTDSFDISPEVYLKPEVALDIVQDTIYEFDTIDIIVIDPVTGHTYVWNTSATDTLSGITVVQTESGSYTVTVTDENGCENTATISVDVRELKCEESDFFIPNAFSPNRDNVNDELFVRSVIIDRVTSYEFVVYNRWGQEIFKSMDKFVGWDGTFKGETLSPDAFAYYIKITCQNDVRYENAGNISLMK